SQPNRGRFAARRAGLEAASGDWVLLLDARVRLDPRSLRFVHDRLDAGERVWNGHVRVDTRGNPYGAFWNTLVELAWREYFDDPRTTSFDLESFDRFPKGTGCFLAPRELVLAALAEFRSAYGDLRHANDDTPLIRAIAASERINISPAFACDYSPRDTLGSFVRHAFHRGAVFLDGHGRRESRFFGVVVAFYPVSAGLSLVALQRPGYVAAAAAGTAALGAVVAAATSRSVADAAAFGALLPLYAVAHGAGMWRGLGLAVSGRARRGVRV
ncbi:MAG: glycosyltransferase, partial [Actinobacteria bacterium]|nr:glycosyltransferase [Actinomycetota bacterium]